MKLEEIAKYLHGSFSGDGNIEISGPAKIESATEGQITFLANPKYKHFLAQTKASAVIVDNNIKDLEIPHIKVDNAYMGFLFVLKLFTPERELSFKGISQNAQINSTAVIGNDCNIAPFVYIGSDCAVGNNCTFYPGVVILDNVKIGDNCIFYPNVSIREDCVVGNNAIFHNGVVVGSDGFGFAPKGDSYEKIPQLGNVIIGNNVEIGANSTIDRATMGSTIIKDGVKLDNLIQIAHNCIVGENTVMAAQAGVAGSTEIGRNVTIGGQVGVSGHIKVNDRTVVAAQSGISKDTEPNSILFGTPALPIMQRKRIDVSLRHLPEYVKRINQLENELIEIREELKAKNGK